MKKLFEWCKTNFFTIATLFLLVFIPLYPKLPLVDIKNTWVYIRVEDIVVLALLIISAIRLFTRKNTLQSPLTMPIFIYWIIGAIATFHGILLLFPTMANVFPNVAFLSFLRRIEYMSLFFIAFWAMKEKKSLIWVSIILAGTLLIASLYGLGQKYFGLPAFLTMNEEFAKGVPIQLSQLSRVPSTFAGHYDFAAYLVLILPILASLIFIVGRIWVKGILVAVIMLGTFALITTVSRISFVAFIIALGVVVFFQKKKLFYFMIPLCLVGVYFLLRSPLVTRYTNTVKEVQVLVNATDGKPIGHIAFVENSYFSDKTVRQQFYKNISDIRLSASPAASIVIPYLQLPPVVPLLTKPLAPTGEDLPQGTGYINLSLSPVSQKINHFFYESNTNEVQLINGTYLVKKTLAYDLSLTTRFQGEWPNTIAAFKKNIFLGSGYGSVSLAVDNSYLRMLGEIGIFGFISFISIFVISGLYVQKLWAATDSRLTKSFIIGVGAGFIGLSINALFIDVFEASKIAFLLWMLVGICVGALAVKQKITFSVPQALAEFATSKIAIIIYISVVSLVLYGPLVSNYFVGDDFTWFRWAENSPLNMSTVRTYFTDSDGFFYRPGAKLYFLLMYSTIWLNQNMYHLVSLLLHTLVAILAFFVASHIFKKSLTGFAVAIMFLFMTGTTEAVFWISATGFLFTSVLTLAGLLSYIHKHTWLAFTFSLLAPLFHELGIVTPLLYVGYEYILGEKRKFNFALLLPIPIYLMARFTANSHWLSGDYNYNVIKLPLNAIGNAIGYAFISVAGPIAISFHLTLRTLLRDHLAMGIFFGLGAGVLVYITGKTMLKKLIPVDRNIVVFSLVFFIVSLLPFLGLGNISSRYGYLSAVGLAILTVFVLQKIYSLLLHNGERIARSLIIIVVGIFSLFQIIQLQALHDNWHEAGDKVNNFVISIDGAYEDHWAVAPMELHFVNVPIRNGDAWVFPVGIPDVLWFQFRNPNLRVFNNNSLQEALNAVEYGSQTQRVFVFDENGRVTETKKPREIQ